MVEGVIGPQSLRVQSSPGRSPAAASHLVAAGAALGAALLILGLARVEARRQLGLRLDSLASQVSPLRMNGNLLQRAAFSNPGVLPVYGSSELDQSADNRPDSFFRGRPTGFFVFPEGHAGTTCLMILQKIAAAGSAVRGKKTVVMLSPSWFARPDAVRHTPPAELPAAQLNAWVFGSPLDRGLKEKLAKRLLHQPDSMRGQTLLTAAVRSLAGQTWKDRCRFAGLWPLGECQHQISLGLEAGTLLWDVYGHATRFRRDARPGAVADKAGPTRQEPNWARLAARAEAGDRARNDGTVYSVSSHEVAGTPREVRLHPQRPGSRDAEFKTRLRSAEEWRDLKLMTEVFSDLGVRAMFISQPINGKFYDLDGISVAGRQTYYKKLTRLVRSTGFPLRDYAEHEDDRFFFNDSGHPSAKAWIYYDQALDRFYHESHP